MQFEWDEAKRLANLAKHGLDFEDVGSVWDRDLFDVAGTRIAGDELRILALGVMGDDAEVIAVVYTVRASRIRLISLRRANRYERQVFRSRFGYGR
ncbi:BrnT family toxin [Blastomonas sp.]|uniref:BrnT family toxin n=1 Tax=Blastomonas sp. TaxID=1909299 RepID=UPI00345D53B1